MYSQQIRTVLAQHARLSVDIDTLTDDTDLYGAGLTSLTTVNLMLALEDHFNVEFTDQMLGRKTFGTIRSLSEAIEELLETNAVRAHSTQSVTRKAAAPHVDFSVILERVQSIGREIIAPAAVEVDRDARFPREAFEALKAAKLLSAYVPVEFGGMGLSIIQLSKICEALGHHCASTAMVFAMHQIQVACIVHHALTSAFFRDYVTALVERQYLLASATTELGIGGDLRSSICAVKIEGDRFNLEKQRP